MLEPTLGIVRHLLGDMVRRVPVTVAMYRIAAEVARGEKFLAELRRRRLARLLLAVRDRFPVYREVLGGLSVSDVERDPEEALSRLPVVGKDEIREIWSQDTQPSVRTSGESRFSGGSTGMPFHYTLSREVIARQRGYAAFFWSLQGYTPGERYVAVGGASFGARAGRMAGGVYDWLIGRRRVMQDGSGQWLRNAVRAVRSQEYAFVYGYPSLLAEVARAIKGANLGKRAVYTTSEMLQPGMRREIEEGFGCQVFDMYGANDGGIVSCECENHVGWHYNWQDCWVEVYGEEGGFGELVLTNLLEHQQPFIRYRVGDAGAVTDGRCECGLGLPRIIRLAGRVRDLIRLASGKVLHGSLFNALVKECGGVREFQVRARRGELRVLVVPETAHPVADTRSCIEAKVRAIVGGEMAVEVEEVAPETLRGTGKYRTVIVED